MQSNKPSESKPSSQELKEVGLLMYKEGGDPNSIGQLLQIKTEVLSDTESGQDSDAEKEQNSDSAGTDHNVIANSLFGKSRHSAKADEKISREDESADDNPEFKIDLQSLVAVKSEITEDDNSEGVVNTGAAPKVNTKTPRKKRKGTKKSKKGSERKAKLKPKLGSLSEKEVDTLVCDVCCKKFSSRHNLRSHKVLHTPKETWRFSCEVCNKKFPFQKLKKRHFLGCHSDARPFPCTMCHRRFKLKPALNYHMKTHNWDEWHECDKCHKKFHRRDSMINHKRFVHRTYACKECDLVFAKLSDWRKHCVIRHQMEAGTDSEGRCFFCSRCEGKFQTKQAFEDHLSTHVGDSNFHLCHVCSSVFEVEWSLSVHLGLHGTSTKHCKCPLCEATFSKIYSLKRHLLKYHEPVSTCPECYLEVPEDAWSEHVASHADRLLFICRVCGKSYTSQSSLTRHMRRESLDTPNVPRECLQCNETYATCFELVQHVTSHGTKSLSDIDPRQMISIGQTDPSVLNEDGTTVEDGESSSYACTLCGFFAKNLRLLRSHKMSHEPKEKNLACTFCEKKFSRKKTLKSHIEYNHLGKERLIATCEICGKCFMHKTNLNRHLLVHQGVRRFSCHMCAQTFTQKTSLNNHLLAHAGVKPHKCPVCEKGFTQKSNLVTHMKRCSPEKKPARARADLQFTENRRGAQAQAPPDSQAPALRQRLPSLDEPVPSFPDTQFPL